MATPNRRLERRMDVVQWLKDDFSVTRVVDLSSYEDKGRYLEGTGSIVFDHTAMVAYACSSVRTDKGVLERLCEEIGYSKVLVEAADSKGERYLLFHSVTLCVLQGDPSTTPMSSCLLQQTLW